MEIRFRSLRRILFPKMYRNCQKKTCPRMLSFSSCVALQEDFATHEEVGMRYCARCVLAAGTRRLLSVQGVRICKTYVCPMHVCTFRLPLLILWLQSLPLPSGKEHNRACVVVCIVVCCVSRGVGVCLGKLTFPGWVKKKRKEKRNLSLLPDINQ